MRAIRPSLDYFSHKRAAFTTHMIALIHKNCLLVSITLTQMYVRMFVRIYVAYSDLGEYDSLLIRLRDDEFAKNNLHVCTCLLFVHNYFCFKTERKTAFKCMMSELFLCFLDFVNIFICRWWLLWMQGDRNCQRYKLSCSHA